MNRIVWISLTAIGCLLGAHFGHQMGRGSIDTGATATAPPPSPASPIATIPPSPPAPQPQDIIAEAVDALRKGERLKPEALKAAMESLDDDALQQEITDAQKVFNRDERHLLMSGLLGALAKRDPDATLEFLRNMDSGFDQHSFSRPVFEAIIESSSAENALALYHKHQLGDTGQLGTSSLFPIFNSLGESDLDAAIAATANIKGKHQRRQMISTICESSGDPENRGKLLAWAIALSDSDEQARALGEITGTWANRENRAAALAWAEENELAPPVLAAVERSLADPGLRQDPKTGAEWLLARATPESRSDHLAHIINYWSHEAPNAAGEWLGQQTLDATADRALAKFADVIAREDPESAHAWASRITNPTSRSNTLDLVMMWWRRLDPAAAAAAATP